MKVKTLVFCGLIALLSGIVYAEPPCYTIDNSRPEWLAEPGQFIRGDANNDGDLHIADVAHLLNYLFRDGLPPSCMDAGDANDDGAVGIADVMYLLNYLFRGDLAPPSPCCDFLGDCGPDPTADALDCQTHICVSGPVNTQVRFEAAGAEGRVELGKAVIVDHQLIVPVYVTAFQPLSVFSYTISYDPTQLVAKSVESTDLVSEEFDFFSGWIDKETGQIRVGNVVSLRMTKTLSVGTYKVANIMFKSVSLAPVFTRELSLRVTEAIFPKTEVNQKTEVGEPETKFETKRVPSYSKGTIEIVWPPDDIRYEMYLGDTFELDVTAICTTPGCSVCVFQGILPVGATFSTRCGTESATSTIIYTPPEVGTYPGEVLAGIDEGYTTPQDRRKITWVVTEPPDLGDSIPEDRHEHFKNRGYCFYQDADICTVCVNRPSCPMWANPVYGDVMVSSQSGSFTGSLGFPLEIVLTYNTGSFFNGRYGYGWQLNYNVRYVTNSVNGNVIVVREDDGTHIFVEEPDGSFKPTYGVRDSLAKLDPDGYLLVTKHGTKYWFESPDHHYMTRLEDRNHNELVFSYNENKELIGVTDPCGRQLTLEYQDNKLTRVTGPGNREVSFGYDAFGDLRWIRNPIGDTTRYEYYTGETGCHDLKHIINARGDTSTFIYNSDYQVESITTCCGTNTYSYDRENRRTTATDENGHSTNYSYDEEDRIIQIEDALGGIILWAWDDDYNKTSETDANGNTTNCTYDSKGNVLTEVNALGDTTWYTWHPVYNRMTSLIDANYHTTIYDYDSLGNLVSETNALGDSSTYMFDSRGLLLTETNARGYTTYFEYDDCGDQIRTIDVKFCTTSYFPDALGNDTLVIDANGNPTRYVYDDLDRLIRMIDALNCSTSYLYDAANNDTLMIDANGNATRYQYDVQNRLTMMIDALGGETSYGYDPVGNRISVANCKGDSAKYDYDNLNRLIRTIDAIDCTTSFAYDPVGNRIAQIDANGHTTTFEYNVVNRLVRTIDALDCTTAYAYDPVGNLASITDGNGKVTYYRYDDLDRLWRIIREMETEADSVVTEYEYDQVGNRTAVIDPNGSRTEYEYNERDELIMETNPEGESTLHEYDCVGNHIEETRPNGNVTIYDYDEKNQLVNISDSIGQVVSYFYDCVGNRLTEIDANNHTTTYQYDALNRLASVTDPMGEKTTYSYDCVGNLDTVVDRNGNPITYAYDALNRRISTTDVLGNLTSYEYDCVSNLTRIIDAKGNATAHEYDAGNRLLREIYADSTTREFTYDCVGNTITRKDQLGNITTYEYNDLSYLTKRDYPETNDDEFTYDKGGRMLTAQNAYSFITLEYDRANRIIETSQNGDTIRYSRNVFDGQRTIFYPGGKVITETRDLRNRLVKVEETAKGVVAHYLYDDANRLLSKSYLNGTIANYSYNANDWVTNLTHTKDATLIAGFEYDFDKEGNRKYTSNLLVFDSAKEYTHSEKYDYDAIYRLVDFKTGQLIGGDIPSPIKTRSWTLDPVGNWDQFSIDGVDYNNTPNQMNEYDDPSTNGPPPIPDDYGFPDDFKDRKDTPQQDGFNFAHDKNGNLVDDDINMYEYDYENRLIRVIRKSDSLTLAEYHYDALSRRIEKHTAGISIVYLYDDARVIEERTGGLVEAEYVYGDWIDEVLSMDRGNQTYNYHSNSLGSTIVLTDALGVAVERYTYDSHGEVSIMDSVGNLLPNSATSNTYLFTGRRWDQDTKLYYYRARYYDPERGRFLQRDPLGYEDGMNLYEYVRGRVTKEVDPAGLICHDPPGLDLSKVDAPAIRESGRNIEVYDLFGTTFNATRIEHRATINKKQSHTFGKCCECVDAVSYRIEIYEVDWNPWEWIKVHMGAVRKCCSTERGVTVSQACQGIPGGWNVDADTYVRGEASWTDQSGTSDRDILSDVASAASILDLVLTVLLLVPK